MERVAGCGVIAVLVIDKVAHAVPLARALLAGGVDVMELTLRTDAALGSLQAIKAAVPEMMAGMGTVLTPAQVTQVAAAGAAFAVAPGFNPRVVAAAQAVDLPFAPGVATPSDIEGAIELGCRVLKFFPAEVSGGMAYLKNIATPYAHLGIRYMPLGGLTAGNIGPYLASPLVAALGGSWLAKRDVIESEQWDTITANARAARAIVAAARGACG